MWRRGLLVDREMHKELRNHWEENSREGNVFTSIQMQPKELNEKIQAECLIEIWFLPLMDKWRLRKKYNERHIWKTPNQWVLIENVSEWFADFNHTIPISPLIYSLYCLGRIALALLALKLNSNLMFQHFAQRNKVKSIFYFHLIFKSALTLLSQIWSRVFGVIYLCLNH